MKKFLIGLGIFVVLIVALAWIVPPLLPVETQKNQLQSRFESATGRKLTIGGDVSLRLLPTIALTANDVTVANAPGAASKDMARIKRLEVRLKLMPLLSGNFAVERFVLVDPVINLEKDKNGKPNWDLSKAEPGKPQTAPATAPPAKKDKGGVSGVQLADVRVTNATITYRDGQTVHKFSKVSLTVNQEGGAAPLRIEGAFDLRGRALSVKALLDNPNSLQEKKGARFSLDVRADTISLSLKGKIEPGDAPKGSGSIDLRVPSLSALAAWLTGAKEQKGPTPGALSLTSGVAINGQSVALDGFKLTLDKITATGRVAVAFAGVPSVTGKIAASPLDLTPYMPPEGTSSAAKPSAKPGSPSTASSGWSTAPIDASALHAFNADLTLDLGAVRVRRFLIDKAALRVQVQKGAMTVTANQLALFGGNGKGTLRLAALSKGVAVAPNLTFAGVKAERLLTAMSGKSRLQGNANIVLNVNGQGASQRAIVSSLRGRVRAVFTNGAIRGFNLAAMLRDLNPGAIASGFNDQHKTDFAELSATFVGNKGTFTTKDIKMSSPLVRLTGEGSVFMPPQTLDLLLKPKLVGSIKGQGGKFDRSGVVIPVRVQGPWSKPSFKPDFAAAIKSGVPDKIKERLPSNIRDKLPKGIPGLGR